MTKETDQLKYEGLASIILTGQEHAKERHDDFKVFVDHRFTGLEKHNEKQNGKINKTMDRVDKLEQGNQYTKLLKWVDIHPRRSIILVLSSWFLVSTIVTNAVVNNWMPRLWELIVKAVA